MNGLALTTPLAANPWWSLWTCHITHWDAQHLLLNTVAAIPPLSLVNWRRLLACAAVSAPLVSLAIVASGFHGEYRGASGLVVGMWVFAGLALLRERRFRHGIALVAFIGTKLAFEASGIWPDASTIFATVSVAHYAGALSALAMSAVAARFSCPQTDRCPPASIVILSREDGEGTQDRDFEFLRRLRGSG